jgi:putative ABC transport system ATP-binding protein
MQKDKKHLPTGGVRMNSQIGNNSVVDIKCVTKIYDSNANKCIALNEINFSASKGELLLLLGPSGSGKTTLLTVTAGFTRPTSGDVFLFGKNITKYSTVALQLLRAERIGFIFQSFLLIDALNVFENVELVLHFSSKNKKDLRNRAFDALQKVGIPDLAKKFPKELSHGEKQRVAIARAFANDADLLIADEPTASLETKQGEEIIKLLHKYASELNKCVIVASHDLRLKYLADKIHYIENGKISNEHKL